MATAAVLGLALVVGGGCGGSGVAEAASEAETGTGSRAGALTANGDESRAGALTENGDQNRAGALTGNRDESRAGALTENGDESRAGAPREGDAARGGSLSEPDVLGPRAPLGRSVASPDAISGSNAVSNSDAASVSHAASASDSVSAALASSPIIAVERGRGGRSLAFRLTLADGTRAYFKPEQTFSGAHWYAEIAAHHLDRALGLGRTPVVVGRRIAWETLAAAAEGDPRVPEVVVGDDGLVRGAMIAWIETRLVPLHAPPGWQRWVAIGPPPAITPFQSPRAWRRACAIAPEEPAPDDVRSVPDDAGAASALPAPEPDTPTRPAELSDLVVFDFLVHNPDRWSASSTNVRTLGPSGPLVFLDQGAGFSPRRARLTLLDARLAAVQRFRRRTIDAVRALDLEALAASLARDPLSPILDQRQLDHLATRRRALLDHVDALVSEHGEDVVYAW